MPVNKYFYPRLVYAAPPVTIDFDVCQLSIPPIQALRGENTSVGGVSETLGIRLEPRVLLSFENVTTATLAQIYAYWASDGWLRKQGVLTLDRFATCAGQWEYDQFNGYFTKAELISNPFAPSRWMWSAARYQLQLLFRQGK